MHRIWLCADDYGISPAVNIAIRDLVVRARLNATSVLVAAPSCHRSEAIALSALNSTARRVAIGLHVALTAPFAPLSRGFAPLRAGAFMPLAATVRNALLRRFDAAVLAAENAWVRQCGRAVPPRVRLADGKGLLLDLASRSFRRRAAALGMRTNPAFAGSYAFTDAADFAALFPRFLDHLPDGAVVMCHPGFVDAELQRLDPLTTLREREYFFLIDDAFPSLLDAHGLTLLPVVDKLLICDRWGR